MEAWESDAEAWESDTLYITPTCAVEVVEPVRLRAWARITRGYKGLQGVTRGYKGGVQSSQFSTVAAIARAPYNPTQPLVTPCNPSSPR